MLTTILTALAGILIGVVGLRLWQSYRTKSAAKPGFLPTDPTSLSESGTTETARAISLPKLEARHVLLAAAAMALIGAISFSIGGEDSHSAQGAAFASAPSSAGQGGDLDDVDTMIQRLAQRLENEPDDAEGFRMLGWSYLMTGKPEHAIAPYERAIALAPDSASAHSGYGEALVAMDDDRVSDRAKSAFETALRLDPTEPRARYFMARWKADNGQRAPALDELIELANSDDPTLPWQADVRREIAALSAELGIDAAARLGSDGAQPTAAPEPPILDAATLAAADQMSGDQRQSMVDGMVNRLAGRLAQNPNDPDGWVRLLRSRMVLTQSDQAAADLQAARSALAANAPGLAKVNDAAVELGVPGA